MSIFKLKRFGAGEAETEAVHSRQPEKTKSRSIAGLLLAAVATASLSVFAPSAAMAAPSPDLFGQVPQFYDAAISPDGTQLAVVQNVKGQYLINIVHMDKTKRTPGKPRLVGLGKGVKPAYVKWVNDNRVVVSFWQTQRINRTPWNAGFLYSLDTQEMKGKVLIRPRAGIRLWNNTVLDWLEDDPDHILMEFADDGEDMNYPDVRKVNVETGRSKVVRRHDNRVHDWVADENGVPRLGSGFEDRDGRVPYMTLLDPTTQTWQSAKNYPGLDPDMDVYHISSDGKTLIVADYQGRDTKGLYKYDLVSKRMVGKLFHNDEFDVSGLITSKDGDEIIGASYVGEERERVLFDGYDTLMSEAERTFKGYSVQFIDQTDEGDKLLIKVTAPYDPGALYLFEGGNKITRILDTYPGLQPQSLGEVISVKYTARDGQKIPAYVTLPSTVTETSQIKNLPFIVLPHGGPYSRDSRRFDWLAQFFGSRGYGVLQMNFRGSEGYGKAFKEQGRDSWTLMQDDVEDGARWLLEKGYADPDRMCAAGWSYGGYSALMGGAKHPELYNCVIAIAALSDIREAHRDIRKTYKYADLVAENTFGAILKDKKRLKANNPVDVAEQIQAPVLLAHGTLDSAVEVDQFKRMRSKLKNNDDAVFLLFDDEDHYMSTQENRQALTKAIDKFLLRHNGKSEFAAK